MEKQVYITDKEREKCQRVMEAYAELYENEDLLVLNAGRYGFVKLQSYRIPKNGWKRSFSYWQEIRRWRRCRM